MSANDTNMEGKKTETKAWKPKEKKLCANFPFGKKMANSASFLAIENHK